MTNVAERLRNSLNAYEEQLAIAPEAWIRIRGRAEQLDQPRDSRRTMFLAAASMLAVAVVIVALVVRLDGPEHRVTTSTSIDGVADVTARVIRFPGRDRRSLRINKGTSDGIALGQVVVARDGLVGRVFAVSRSRATVTLIDDPDFWVGVRLDHGGVTGLASGHAPNHQLRLSFLSQPLGACREASSPERCITTGDLVRTDDVEGAGFPPDIPVATVTKIEKGQTDLVATIVLEPLVDFDDLRYVKVLQPNADDFSARTLVLQGSRSGLDWEMFAYNGEHGFCVDFRVAGSGAIGCGVISGGLGLSWGSDEAGPWVRGWARKDVAPIRVELSNGEALEVVPTATPDFDVKFFAVPLPSDSQSTRVLAFDAAGKKIAEKATPW